MLVLGLWAFFFWIGLEGRDSMERVDCGRGVARVKGPRLVAWEIGLEEDIQITTLTSSQSQNWIIHNSQSSLIFLGKYL